MHHPAAEAIEELFTTFGGSWPPKPDFTDWPSSWQPYANLADQAPLMCDKYNDPEKLRLWITTQLVEQVELVQVLADLDHHLVSDNMKLLGLFAALTYLVQLYRWGTNPVTEKEAKRMTITFPEGIWAPFTKLSDFWTMTYRGNVFGMCLCNALYEDDTNQPTGMRFHFNAKPEIIETEVQFLTAVLNTECIFSTALPLIKEYLNQTEQCALSDVNTSQKLEGKRVELLREIRNIVVKVLKNFTGKMKADMIRIEYWASHVEAITGWSINGVDHGASGGECLTFHVLDEFLGTQGECKIAKAAVKKRKVCSPQVYKSLLNNLMGDDRQHRFISFLTYNEKEEDPVAQAYRSIVQSLYLWRLTHTKNAPVYLEPSTMTSGGTVDMMLKEGEEGEDIASMGKMALHERAEEVGNHLKLLNRVSVVTTPGGYGKE